jgi:hypothetical protein
MIQVKVSCSIVIALSAMLHAHLQYYHSMVFADTM